MINFKTVFLALFIVGAIAAVIVFSVSNNSGSSGAITGTVVLWGPFPTQNIEPYINTFNIRNSSTISIKYVEKSPDTFANDLTEAIAAGNPPDLVLMSDSTIHRFRDKIIHFSFTNLPADVFANTFIEAANVFMTNDGYTALPWAADPMIMYYNRDLLSNIGMATPPKDWKTLTDTIPQLTKKQNDLTLTQSAMAMGTYSNISHAKDILALLFMESKNPFMTYDGVKFNAHFGGGGLPNEYDVANQVLSFYTSFADPLKVVYSWNAGQILDRDAFAQSSLVYYFGTASELPGIRAENPNLNFMMALPPQTGTSTNITTGRIYGFVIPKTAKNQLLSYTTANMLNGTDMETELAGQSAVTLSLIPARRDVIALKQNSDPYLNFLYKAVLVQKSWYDPGQSETNQILDSMIKNINAATFTINAALAQAEKELDAIATKY